MNSSRRLAHDLNNIAFVISGYAQRIEEELPKTHPLQEDVQAILNEIPRLTAIGEQIRSLAQMSEPASSVIVE
jgi:signal transduction histidine kinase